jgi:hypothetical protein
MELTLAKLIRYPAAENGRYSKHSPTLKCKETGEETPSYIPVCLGYTGRNIF